TPASATPSLHDALPISDEYYIDLSQNEGLAQFLVRFFDIADTAEPEKIAAVSISENVNGDLVLTLWQTFSTSTHPNREGVLLRRSEEHTSELQSRCDIV